MQIPDNYENPGNGDNGEIGATGEVVTTANGGGIGLFYGILDDILYDILDGILDDQSCEHEAEDGGDMSHRAVDLGF